MQAILQLNLRGDSIVCETSNTGAAGTSLKNSEVGRFYISSLLFVIRLEILATFDEV